jgi:phosphoribosylformylglycinamidine synthase
VVRTAKPSLAASEYEAMYGSSPAGLTPVDLEREKRLIAALLGAVGSGLIRSAHDVAEGGLAVALTEACFNPENLLGAEIDAAFEAAELFGEGPSTIILTAKEAEVPQVTRMFIDGGIECRVIGKVLGEPRLRIASSIEQDVRELNRIFEGALPGRF